MWKRLKPSTNLYPQKEHSHDKSFLSYAPQKSRNQSQDGKRLTIPELVSKARSKSIKKEPTVIVKKQHTQKQVFENYEQNYNIHVIQASNLSNKSDEFIRSPKKSIKTKDKNRNLEVIIQKLKDVNEMLRKTVALMLQKFKDFSKNFQQELQNMMKNKRPQGFPDTTLSSIAMIPQNFIKTNSEKNLILQNFRRLSTIEMELKDFEQDQDVLVTFGGVKKKLSKKEDCQKINKNSQDLAKDSNIPAVQKKGYRGLSQHERLYKHQRNDINNEQLQNRNKRSSSRHSSIKQTQPAKQVMIHFNQTLIQMKKLMRAELNKNS